MAIQSTISQKPIEKEETYPCLKISNFGTIVLFEREKWGTVVGLGQKTSSFFIIGSYQKEWCMDCFKPFEGKVVLNNL